MWTFKRAHVNSVITLNMNTVHVLNVDYFQPVGDHNHTFLQSIEISIE